MKTHRPWQPHMSTSPLFNPFTPSSHTTLERYDLIEEEAEENTTPTEEVSADETSDPPPIMKRD